MEPLQAQACLQAHSWEGPHGVPEHIPSRSLERLAGAGTHLLSQDDIFMAILDSAGLNPHPPVLTCALLSGVAIQLNHGILPDAFY